MQDLAKILQDIRLELSRLSATVDLLEQRYCIAQPKTQVTKDELRARKELAKSKDRGDVVACPACGIDYTKTHSSQIFCIPEHKDLFNSLLEGGHADALPVDRGDLPEVIPTLQELQAKKALAKSKAYGDTAECPACGVSYVKTNCGQVFCQKDHKNLFDSMVRRAS